MKRIQHLIYIGLDRYRFNSCYKIRNIVFCARTEFLGLAKNFVHKVMVGKDINPVLQSLQKLPFRIRNTELHRLETAGFIDRIESFERVSSMVAVGKNLFVLKWISSCRMNPRALHPKPMFRHSNRVRKPRKNGRFVNFQRWLKDSYFDRYALPRK